MTTFGRSMLIVMLAIISFLMVLAIRDCNSQSPVQIAIGKDAGLADKLSDFIKVCSTIQELYIEERPCSKLIDTAMRGMTVDLDVYSNIYIGTEEVRKVLNITDGKKYMGVGIEMVVIGSETFITEVLENHPVASTGIKPGDEILEINGTNIRGMSFDDISNLIVGEAGTSVNFRIRSRRSRRVETYLLPRRVINVNSVAYKAINDDYSYIKIRDFSEKSATEFYNLMANAKDKSGLIMDLRNNLGGLIVPTVDIVGFFIGPDQLVITSKGRTDVNLDWKTSSSLTAGQYPKKIIILTNRYSASASEIMVGSLKHYGLVTVIGERTYGKGVYQRLIDISNQGRLPDKNTNLILSLTVGHYYLPDGTDIHKVGIKPDIEIRQPQDFRAYEYLTEKDAQFQAALDFLRKK